MVTVWVKIFHNKNFLNRLFVEYCYCEVVEVTELQVLTDG
jgi:hypothetical protein